MLPHQPSSPPAPAISALPCSPLQDSRSHLQEQENRAKLRIAKQRSEENGVNMIYPRAGIRIPVELPVEIRWKSRVGRPRQVKGKTASISGNGMMMSVPKRLRDQTPITITVRLPIEFTKVPLELLCHGRVVAKPAQFGGFGAIIDDYQLRPARRPA